jgi:hypothetical protein
MFSIICRYFRSDGTRIQTGDTMIFSLVEDIAPGCWVMEDRYS